MPLFETAYGVEILENDLLGVTRGLFYDPISYNKYSDGVSIIQKFSILLRHLFGQYYN